MWIDAVSDVVVNEATAIHREFGPGLIESVYENVLAGRLESRRLMVERQVQFHTVSNGQCFDVPFKIDIYVERALVLEIKTVDQLTKAHEEQLLTCLRILKLPFGLLLNFSEATMKDGIRRVVNDYKPD